MTFIAYKITCLVNGKGYIGITSQSVRQRWAEHRSDAKKELRPTCILHRAIRRHGECNFWIEELTEAVSWKELVVLERGLIASHGTYKPGGYNMTSGGEGNFGRQYSLEERKARSERAKQQFSSDEARRRISEDRKRYFSDPEVLRITRERTIAQFSDPAARAASSARATAMAIKPERRKLQSEIMKRYFSDPEKKEAFMKAIKKRRKPQSSSITGSK